MKKIILEKCDWQIFLLIGTFTLFHIITAATTSLGDDEAYYWQLSRHIALSYYDHPPLVVYLIYLSTTFFGNSPLAIRFFNILMLPMVSLMIYQICKYLYQDKIKARNGVLIFNLLPPFLIGSLLISPDGPLIFCYTLALYLFILIIYTNNKQIFYWLGVIIGIGLLSKYSMILFVLSSTIYFLLNKNQKHWLYKKEPYLALIIALIIFTPVLFWNYQHNFASFKFQFYSRHMFNFQIINLLGFIGLQFLLLSPILAIAMLIVWIKRFYDPVILFLSCFCLPVFILFSLISIFSPVRINWPLVSYIPLIIIFVSKRFDKITIIGIISTITLSILVTIQAYYPIIKIQPLKNDPTTDLYSWKDVASNINNFMLNSGNNARNWFIFTNRFQSSAQLDYNLNGHYQVYSLANHVQGPDFWQNESQIIGKDGLLVMNNSYEYKPEEKYNCKQIILYKVIPIIRAETVYRRAYIYKCYNYQGRK